MHHKQKPTLSKGISAISLLFLFLFNPILSWSNHAGITYMILEKHWSKEPLLKVESLESFLDQEKTGIAELFSKIEASNHLQAPHYPKLNESLAFSPNSSTKKGELVRLFFTSLRLNPNHKPSLYLQLKSNKPVGTAIPLEEITILEDKGKLPKERFVKIGEGSQVKAGEVVATATDEPDYGMDLYLFADNDSSFGKEFGFGEQPFGNPKYEYSSQAPFHMGFYHESGLVYSLAPFLAKTYPKVRIQQFTELSKFAFEKGHDYWGYRFAGWALHYIQDLTQPYHSSVLPRVGTTRRIGVQIASMVGWGSPKDKMVQRVSDRHTLIEEYQYFIFRKLREEKNPDHPVLQAFQKDLPADLVWKGEETIQNAVTYSAYELSDKADEELEDLDIQSFTTLYEPEHPLHQILVSCLTNTNQFSRLFLNSVEPKREKK